MDQYRDIQTLIERVRARWRALRSFQAAARAALAVTGVLALAVLAARWTGGAPVALAIIALAAVGIGVAAALWGLLPLRQRPNDRQVARFIEESEPGLDDRLVSAVDVASKDAAPPPAALRDAMLADAARRARAVNLDTIVPPDVLRRAGFQAAAAAVLFLAVSFSARHVVRQAFDAVALTMFPARVALQVTPGTTRVKAGTPLEIRAHLVGNRAPVIAQLQIANGDDWRAADMTTTEPGHFRTALGALSRSFKYRVVAGTITSPTFDVTVAHPPRVARIDVEYAYPDGLGLKPRTEHDAGDVYAPAGTDVRLRVFTDRPAATGQLTLGGGAPLTLSADNPTQLTASLKVTHDDSYRVALADRDGLANPGDTEYFIRILEDRPPEVRILKPAADRSVTRLEEVDIEAQAEDDYGIDRLDLVYSVRGDGDKIVPLDIPKKSTSVSGRHTLYLEDLDVRPGDFVSYYVRARDLTRGTRPNEARSDIFFLEVKPYEQEFALAQTQNSAGAGGGGTIDDLVAAQKDIVVSTWKLDRRAQASKGAKSEQDIRAVSRAEAELKTRVEAASSNFRESTMRDPRRRPAGRGRGAAPQPELKAGQTLPEEDEMGAAAEAMTKAVASLDALKTAEARPPELEALNHLLRAQADVRKREVMRQQAGSGAGNNRSNYDLSTLFDKELQRAQQTNYENRTSAENKDDKTQSALDRIRELAQRQDELLKRQQELARKTLTEEELRRELDKLTREQSELRQKAEDLARQMAGQQAASQDQQQQQGQQAGKAGESGQRNQSGQGQGQSQSSQGQGGRSQGQGQAQGNSGSPGDAQQRLRDASEEMRNATNDLRRQDPTQAASRGSRALESLRQLERQLDAARPDERRRALGELQLEARQLADAQRQIASELAKSAAGDAGKDSVRRLAGEQERLAERARRLQDGLKQQGSAPQRQAAGAAGGRGDAPGPNASAAATEAAREIERQRLADRMQQTADAMRSAAERGGAPQRGSTAQGAQPEDARGQTAQQQEIARTLDRLADKLAAATTSGDGESKKLSEQLARAQGLRERIDRLSAELREMTGQSGRAGGAQGGQRGQGESAGQGTASPSSRQSGSAGRSGEGAQAGGGGAGTDLAHLRDEYQRALQETRELTEQMRRDDPGSQSYSRGGAGFTFEGQGMTLSAPGTEAFKQDFAKWEDLRRQATQALEQAESSLSQKLQAKEAKERLASGADDKAPPEYRKQVDDYFKAIAKKKGG